MLGAFLSRVARVTPTNEGEHSPGIHKAISKVRYKVVFDLQLCRHIQAVPVKRLEHIPHTIDEQFLRLESAVCVTHNRTAGNIVSIVSFDTLTVVHRSWQVAVIKRDFTAGKRGHLTQVVRTVTVVEIPTAVVHLRQKSFVLVVVEDIRNRTLTQHNRVTLFVNELLRVVNLTCFQVKDLVFATKELVIHLHYNRCIRSLLLSCKA